MAKGRTFTGIIKIQIVVNHLMNHDVPECLFIEIEVVGHKNRHVTLFDRLVLFSPLICELPQGTIGMHETELGRSQLVVKIQAVALPEHTRHRVVICYHYQSIFSKTLQN